MTVVILFVFGAIAGSFLNVVGLRWNSGLSLGGRSFCNACGRTLRWYELVPIFSFLWLKGRCSKCRTKISIQYSLIELWTGLIFITVPYIFLPAFCIYIVIVIYDLRHKIIPDNLIYTAILLSVVGRWLSTSSTLDWLSGPVIFSFFGLIWLLSRGKAMGFGDAKLGLAIGLLLGASAGLSAVILAFWLGATFGIISMIFYRKKITMKSEVPFAPFLVAGAWLALVFNLDLLHVSSF